MVIRRDFWAGKRVLVTGHTGFKGQLAYSVAEGARRQRVGLCPRAADRSLAVAAARHGGRNRQSRCRRPRFPGAGAACSRRRGPRSCFTSPRSRWCAPPTRTRWPPTQPTSWARSMCWRPCAKRPGVRVVVNVTSDKCYENREWARGYREDDAMGGRDPYSSSKGCAELVTAAYRNSFFSEDADSAALASVRAGNVIGGGDWAADRLVPDFVRATRQASRSGSAIPRPPARGSMCWNRCMAICRSPERLVGGRRRVRGRLELRPRRRATLCRSRK